jgi:hypothetical protein
MMGMRWEPVCHRTVQQQPCVLRNSSSVLSICSSPLISAVSCGGQDIYNQFDTYRQPWLSFHSQLYFHAAEQGLQNLHRFIQLFCDRGRCIKPHFSFMAIHYTLCPEEEFLSSQCCFRMVLWCIWSHLIIIIINNNNRRIPRYTVLLSLGSVTHWISPHHHHHQQQPRYLPSSPCFEKE